MTVPQKRTLLEETELLITELVRDARRRRKVVDGEQVRYVTVDILDRVRAAQAALTFLQRKGEIAPPEKEETEFERQQREFHAGAGAGAADSPRKGDAAGPARVNGHALD